MRVIALLMALLLVLPVAAGQIVYTAVPTSDQAQTTAWTPTYFVCGDGATQCDGTRFQRCSNNAWDTEDTCSSMEWCDANKGCVPRTTTPQEITRITTPPALYPTRQVSPAATLPETLALPRVYKTRLICPVVPKTRLSSSPQPWGANDCDLLGKGKDIDDFLTAMEKKAAACKARRAAVWTQVLDAKADLDKQVDALEVPPPGKMVSITAPVCQGYGDYEPSEPLELPVPGNQQYTHWLKDIEKNVNKYCTLVDELLKPMWRACDQINFYSACQPLDDKNRAQYHKYIATQWGIAQTALEYTDFFYSNVLQTTGWGNFRKYFNEKNIECPGIAARALPGSAIGKMGIGGKSEYDEFGRVIKTTEVTRDESAPDKTTTKTTEMEYNELGRVIEKKETTYEPGIDMETESIKEMEYDQFGRITRIKTTSGKDPAIITVTEFEYDELGRVVRTKETTWESGKMDKATTTITEFEYDEYGNVVKKQEQVASDEAPPKREEQKKEPVLQRIRYFFRRLFGR